MLPSGKAAATSRFHSASGSPSRRSSRPVCARESALGLLALLSQHQPGSRKRVCGGDEHSGYMHEVKLRCAPLEGVRSPSPYKAAFTGSAVVSSMY